jgi:hypothetical protein
VSGAKFIAYCSAFRALFLPFTLVVPAVKSRFDKIFKLTSYKMNNGTVLSGFVHKDAIYDNRTATLPAVRF